MKRLAIFGASGHGKVVADCAESAGWKEIVFYDDAWPKRDVNGIWNIVGNMETLLRDFSQYDGIIIAIGNNSVRLAKQNELSSNGALIVSVIHPSAVISKSVSIGLGSVVMANAVINVDSKIGDCCIINTAATVDHDCTLGDGVHVSPGANLAGGVVVGNCSWVGIGSNIRQLVNIGEETIIGAGATVVNDIESHCTVVGIPAK